MNYEKVLLENQKDTDSLYGKILKWKQGPIELTIPREKIDESMLKYDMIEGMKIGRHNDKYVTTMDTVRHVAEQQKILFKKYVNLMEEKGLSDDDVREAIQMGMDIDGDIVYAIDMKGDNK